MLNLLNLSSMRNKFLLLFLFFSVTIFFSFLSAQQLAFPGAEGFGKYALGARGVSAPEVYHVTNLNDSGAGSFRDAISKPGRIVVFDVCGVINLKSRLVFSPNLYVAGQTAPGDGVVIYGNGSSFSGANNIIIRHLRIYMGKGGDSGKDTAGAANGTDMMLDHLSLAWGLDENFSINWDSKGTEPGNITIQNSIIGQGIMTHSAGGLIQSNNGVSIIGCLYIDNKTRNPRGRHLIQYLNNVIYNWGGDNGFILGGTTGDSWVQIEGNYFIAGPGSSKPFCRGTNEFQVFQQNNYVDSNKDGILNGRLIEKADYGTVTFVESLNDFVRIPKLHPIASNILSPQQALDKVIASVGASLPARSHVDAFMVDELLSYGTKGKFIAHERENGIPNNIGIVSTGTKPLDSDGDGIPDWWEDANGLDKNNPSDAVQLAANGYLNIENYINSIDGPVAPYLRCASNITMTNRTTNSITISWENNSTDAEEIEVQVAKDNESFKSAGTIGGNTVSYTITALDEDTYYNIRLISKKSGLEDSTPSEIFRETTMGPARMPDKAMEPTPAVGETSRFYTSVDFAWQDNTRPWGGDITYDVYFGTSAETLSKVADQITEKSFTYSEGNMNMNDSYYWRVDNTNNQGTTTGDVWNFKAGMYSFVSTYVDLGTDFDGSNNVNPQSGVKFSSSKSYTVNNEVVFTVSGAAVNVNDNKDNLYGNGNGGQTSNKTAYINMSGDTHYVQGTLTAESSEKNIASVKINGTSATTSDPAIGYVLFSDDANFNTKSIVGYEEFEIAKCRFGDTGVTISAPLTAKSFRIYRVVTIGSVGEDLYEINGTVNAETLKGSGNLRIGYIGVNLQLESLDDPSYKDPDNSMKNLTINGKTAIFNQDDNSFTYEFMKGTILGEWPVIFELGSSLATVDFVSGSKHNFANGPLTITVTAQNGSAAAYTVTATVSDKITVGILTATGGAASYDNLLLSAFDGYNVQFIQASETAPADINAFYQDYDLLVLHASVAGKNATGVETRKMVGVKPILNMKAFFYSGDRWQWSSPANTEIGRMNSNVEAVLQNHPIFNNVTFDGDKLVLFAEPTTVVNAFQYVDAPLAGSNWTAAMNAANNTLATIDGDATKVHIHELNLDKSAKYLLFGLSNEGDSYLIFNNNAVNMLKNAADYLLNPNVYYDFETNSVVGINDYTIDSNIRYFNGYISNPDREDITVFNTMGMRMVMSQDELIDVQYLNAGLYIAEAKSKTIKFIVR